MKCEDIKLLLSDDELTSAAKEHISSCGECRDFRRDIEVIMKNPKTFETTEEIDNKVLSFAKANRPEVKKKGPIPFYLWTAIAAAAILVIGFVMMKAGTNADKNDDNVAKKQEIIIEKDTPEDRILKKKMVAKDILPKVQYDPSQNVDDLQMILEDDLLDAEMGALEGELFVLGSEFLD